MYELCWTNEAIEAFETLQKRCGSKRNSRQAGLFKQVVKALKFLRENPSLKTHVFSSMEHPWSKKEKVFDAYAQNRTPGAYRIFWCYGPEQSQMTIIAITPHL